MRKIQWLITLALFVPATLIACKTPAEKEDEARAAQEKANVTVTQAQIDLDKARDKAVAEADEKIQNAQKAAASKINTAVENADNKATEATVALSKDKTEFKNLANQKIADLKRDRITLEEDCARSVKLSQGDARAALDDIDAKLMTAHNDLLTVDAASTKDFEDAEIRVNRDLTDIRKAMEDLGKRR